MTFLPSRADHWGHCLLTASFGLLGLLGSGEQAFAADCRVTGTTTVANGDAGCVLDGSDRLDITSTGRITTTGVDAVHAEGEGNTVNNDGSIETRGENALGIFMSAGAGDNTVLGNGWIRTHGDVSFGIYGQADMGSNSISAGDISTKGGDAHGIYALGLGGENVLSARSITTAGDRANGILAWARDGNIIHVGDVSTTGAAASGIVVASAAGDNKVRVDGIIRTQGQASFGIASSSDTGRTTIQASDILTQGDYGYAIWSFSAGTDVKVNKISAQNASGIYVMSSTGDNSVEAGEISSASEAVHLFTQSGDNRLTVGKVTTWGGSAFITAQTLSGSNTINIRDVSTSGEGAVAIFAQSDNGRNSITTTGKVLTFGEDAIGILALSGSGANVVTNSGMIVAEQSQAIVFRESAENTLNLLIPSFIGGRFLFDSHIDHLNIETGSSHSVLWNFSDDPNAAPHVSGRVPYFFNNKGEFAVIDPSGFAAMPNLLGDLANVAAETAVGPNRTKQDGVDIWAAVTGSQKDYDGEAGATLSQSISTSAAIIGADILATNGANFGVMAGFNDSSVSINAPYTYSYANGAKGVFFGLYGKRALKRVRLSYALAGGRLHHRDDRFVNDNLATINNRFLGRSAAKSNYYSTWLSQSIHLSVPLAAPGGVTITPDLQLLYALQTIGGHTEQGSQADAKVSSRVVQLGEMDAGLVASKALGGILLSTRAGYSYRGVLGGDSATVSMIGETTSVPSFFKARGTAYLGADVSICLGGTATLRLKADAIRGGGVKGASAAGSFVVKF